MKFAVIVFPGSNCDMDLYYAVRDILKEEVELVDYRETSLDGFDAVLIPGGFSYGDYLRCGAIAKVSNIMPAIVDFANQGKLVFGTCNGFQILTEAGLLPGALHRNKHLKFICQQTPIKVVNAQTAFTNQYKEGEEIKLPIAHMEGNYYCDEATYASLVANKQIVFEYVGQGPNGSYKNIAGIMNQTGNVMGMMPHPERAVEAIIGNTDGQRFFASMLEAFMNTQKKG